MNKDNKTRSKLLTSKENKKIVLNSKKALAQIKSSMRCSLANLNMLKNKTSYLNLKLDTFNNSIANARIGEFINEIQCDVLFDNVAYLRLYKAIIKNNSYRLIKVDENIKLRKKDNLVLFASNGTKILCLNLDKHDKGKKEVAEILKRHSNNGVELNFMKLPIFNKIKKDKAFKDVSYTSKDLKRLTNLKNPFMPITKICNQLLIFVECFKCDDGFTLEDILNLFVYIKDDKNSIKKKVDEITDYVYEVKQPESKNKSKKK